MNLAANPVLTETSVTTTAILVATHAATPGDEDIRVGALARWLDPLDPARPVLAVGERFLHADSAPWLSLPVVDHGRPVGSVSRYDLMQRVYIKPFGRELYGKRAISVVMHTQPLVLAADASIEEAGRYINAHIRQPITEDFIVVDQAGQYLGAGKVLDLLGALERRIGAHSLELEQAYRKLKSSQSQLIQSEKMASLGQMVAGIAHEMNTPLGYVRNNVEMTRDSLAGVQGVLAAYEQALDTMLTGADDKAVEQAIAGVDLARGSIDEGLFADLSGVLEDTVFGVDQIADLVASLKDFSRRDQVHAESVDVHRLIESERRFCEVPQIECAPAQINQVLLNLVTNAAQAIERSDGRISIHTHASAQFVLIAIEDNGKGIEPRHLEHIFDPFFTTKPVGQGTGLGLAICYQIIGQHGGRIRATSTVGVGTRFIVALPIRAVTHTNASEAS
ncbi:MAG: CBS domain-containing protein [Gammaproteobacteria bacterium]|nr:MAG: CBS domain-containing protein [Gammaproteobacteria bacterium]